jgi:hypothetical protein
MFPGPSMDTLSDHGAYQELGLFISFDIQGTFLRRVRSGRLDSEELARTTGSFNDFIPEKETWGVPDQVARIEWICAFHAKL